MIPILHRDARCVAVDKPSGVATHRGWADDDDALLQLVRDTVDAYVYPIHRLDRGASGVTLFALDKEAARAFSDAWPFADKRYLAITRGHPPEHLMIDHAIPKAPGLERVPAKTEIWRKDTFGRYALVEARPHTGRLHQIRRHLKHISCPLIGDVRYGKGEHNRLWRDKLSLHRLALHCSSLRVPHPDGNELVVECALAPDMTDALAAARALFA
ncbi:MAG TPA: pseudouridine synthase [Kofleriaceae bacterium]|nr:pseudouridine synthase [Kofleriaceae bacterium]